MFRVCPTCGGLGETATHPTCPSCFGHGLLLLVQVECPVCKGCGEDRNREIVTVLAGNLTVKKYPPCTRCQGQGFNLISGGIIGPLPEPVDCATVAEAIELVLSGRGQDVPRNLRQTAFRLIVADEAAVTKTGLARGEQLAAVLTQGGKLVFATDGIYHILTPDQGGLVFPLEV